MPRPHRVGLIIALSGLALRLSPLSAAEPEVLAEWRKDPAGARLPDFSYAGYRAGASLPARVPGPLFRVTDFGAVPNDGKDDVDAIQRAVDAAAKAGGGVVLFPAGTFDFDVGTRHRFVRIRSSNIVLRGAGSGEDGTVLRDHTHSEVPPPAKNSLAHNFPGFIHAGPTDATEVEKDIPDLDRVVTGVLPAARKSLRIEVDQPEAIRTGTTYLLTLTDTDNSLVTELARPLARADLGANYTKKGRPKFFQFITVRSLEGRQATLDAPLLWELRAVWKPRLWEVPVLREIGVEDIRFRSNWRGPFEHHKNAEHDGGWDHVRFDSVENGWVRDTVHDSTTAAVQLSSAKHCVIQRCRVIGTRGHFGFRVLGASTGNLLMDLEDGDAYHSFELQGYPSGNVFLRCRTVSGRGMDLHGGLGVHNLFDNPAMGKGHGGSDNATPPRVGAGLVLWNWQPRVRVDEEIPDPIVVGGGGQVAEPRSLYEHQRAARLGRAQAVDPARPSVTP